MLEGYAEPDIAFIKDWFVDLNGFSFHVGRAYSVFSHLHQAVPAYMKYCKICVIGSVDHQQKSFALLMRCESIPDDFGVKIKRAMEKIIKSNIIEYSTERGIDELLRNGELIGSTASLTRDGKKLFGVYFREALEGTYVFRYFLLTLIDQFYFLLIEAWIAEKTTPLPWTCGGISLSFGSKAQLKDGDLYDYFVSELVNREVFSLPKEMRDVLPEFCHGITIVWRYFMTFKQY